MSNFETKKYNEQEIPRQELSRKELQTRLEAFKHSQKQVKEIQMCEIEEKTKEQDILKNFGIKSLEDLLEKYFTNPEEGILILKNIDKQIENKYIQKENILDNATDFELDNFEVGQVYEFESFGEYETTLEKYLESPQIKKTILILDILNVYYEYLNNYKNNITAKGIRVLDNNIDLYLNDLNTLRSKISLGVSGAESLSDYSLQSSINQLFLTAQSINGSGTFSKVKTKLPRLHSFLNNLISNYDAQNHLDLKYDALKIIRDIDENDSLLLPSYYSSDIIREKIVDYVLNNDDLLENPNIQKRFEAINKISQNSQEFANELFLSFKDKTLNWDSFMGSFYSYYTDNSREFLISQGIDINGALRDIQKFLESTIGIKKEIEVKNFIREDAIKEFEEKGLPLSQELLNEIIRLRYSNYEENIKKELVNFIRQRFTKWVLKAFGDDLKDIRQNNPFVDMYANINGLGDFELSDETVNNISKVSQEIAIQVPLIFVSGGAGSLVVHLGSRQLIRAGLIASQAPRINTLSGAGRVATAGGIDGSVFHFSYRGLNGLLDGENPYSDGINTKEWLKDMLFISALRTLNNVQLGVRGIQGDNKSLLNNIEDLFTIQGNNLRFNEKVWNTIGVKGISVGTEVGALIAIGSGINIMFGDEIGNNPNEIIEAISIVLGLRMMNRTFGDGGKILVNKVDGKIQVKELKQIQSQIQNHKDSINKINTQIQKGEYTKITNRGKQENNPDTIVAKHESNIRQLEQKKQDINKVPPKEKPPETGFNIYGMSVIGIPLSDVFERGEYIDGYQQIRDKIINEAISKNGYIGLRDNKEFITKRDNFIEKYLNDPATLLYLERMKSEPNRRIDIEYIKTTLINDFNSMLEQLSHLEILTKDIPPEQLESRQKELIKEMFANLGNERLGEVLVKMFDEEKIERIHNKKRGQ